MLYASSQTGRCSQSGVKIAWRTHFFYNHFTFALASNFTLCCIVNNLGNHILLLKRKITVSQVDVRTQPHIWK